MQKVMMTLGQDKEQAEGELCGFGQMPAGL